MAIGWNGQRAGSESVDEGITVDMVNYVERSVRGSLSLSILAYHYLSGVFVFEAMGK